MKKEQLEAQDLEYWKKQYEEQNKQQAQLQGKLATVEQQLSQVQTLYNDKMRELNEFAFLLMQFTRETLTKQQKEEMQKKLQMLQPPAFPNPA